MLRRGGGKRTCRPAAGSLRYGCLPGGLSSRVVLAPLACAGLRGLVLVVVVGLLAFLSLLAWSGLRRVVLVVVVCLRAFFALLACAGLRRVVLVVVVCLRALPGWRCACLSLRSRVRQGRLASSLLRRLWGSIYSVAKTRIEDVDFPIQRRGPRARRWCSASKTAARNASYSRSMRQERAFYRLAEVVLRGRRRGAGIGERAKTANRAGAD